MKSPSNFIKPQERPKEIQKSVCECDYQEWFIYKVTKKVTFKNPEVDLYLRCREDLHVDKVVLLTVRDNVGRVYTFDLTKSKHSD